MIPLTSDMESCQTHRSRKLSGSYQGPVERVNGYRVLVLQDENFRDMLPSTLNKI